MRRAACSLRLGLLTVGTALTVASCFVAGFDLAEPATTTTSTAAAGSGGGGSGGSGAQGGNDPCQSATWPDPPSSSDPGPDNVELVVALRSLDFGESYTEPEGPTVGYDLDGRCTCQGQGMSCTAPEYATDEICDGPAGRDNAMAMFLKLAQVFTSELSSERQSEQAETGHFSVLFRVRNYNGQPNDSEIEVAMFPSGGTDESSCGGGAGEPPLPLWNGTDAWPISATALNRIGTGGAGGCSGGSVQGYDIDSPKYVDPAGYVTGGVLVAGLPDAEIELPSDGQRLVLAFTQGFISGQLEQQGGAWYLRNALLVGRWQVEDVFRTLSGVVSGGDPFCTGDPIYQAIKSGVCEHPDIAATPGTPTHPCDAISFGMAFDADPAQLGRIYEVEPPTSECDPSEDPANDTCENDS